MHTNVERLESACTLSARRLHCCALSSGSQHGPGMHTHLYPLLQTNERSQRTLRSFQTSQIHRYIESMLTLMITNDSEV